MRKCFENIARITFGDDLSMSEMTSAEGETVKFSEILYPRGNVENWLTDVERVMMASVREFLKISIAAYPDMERTDWVLKWPGQVVIAGCQTYWAQEVEEAITSNNMVEYCEKAGIHRPGQSKQDRPHGIICKNPNIFWIVCRSLVKGLFHVGRFGRAG